MLEEKTPLNVYRRELQVALGGRKGRAYTGMKRALNAYREGVLDIPDDRSKSGRISISVMPASSATATDLSTAFTRWTLLSG